MMDDLKKLKQFGSLPSIVLATIVSASTCLAVPALNNETPISGQKQSNAEEIRSLGEVEAPPTYVNSVFTWLSDDNYGLIPVLSLSARGLPKGSPPFYHICIGKNGEEKVAAQLQTSQQNFWSVYTVAEVRGISGQVQNPLAIANTNSIFFEVGSHFEDFSPYKIFNIDRKSGEIGRAYNVVQGRRPISYLYWTVAPNAEHIAYVTGGGTMGQTDFAAFNSEVYMGPRQLHVYNCKSSKESTVVTDDSISAPYNWLNDTTLLYSAVPWVEQQVSNAMKKEELRVLKQKAAKAGNSTVYFDSQNYKGERSIFLYSVRTGTSSLLIQGANSPVPSPDQGKIAYFENAGSLCVIESNGRTGKKQIDKLAGNTPIFWSGNSKYIYGMIEGEKTIRGNEIKIIKQWEIDSGKVRNLITLEARHFIPATLSARFKETAHWEFVGTIGKENDTLVSLTVANKELPTSVKFLTFYEYTTTFFVINGVTGQIKPLARITDTERHRVTGVSWSN